MNKQIKAAVVSALVGIVLASMGGYWNAFDGIERQLYDQRHRVLRGQISAPENVVLVMVDETSIAQLKNSLGRFPWPRWIYGEALQFIASGQPKAVVFDILFSEPDLSAPEHDLEFAQAASESPTVFASRILLREADAVDGPDMTSFQLGDGDSNVRGRLVAPIPALLGAARAVGFVDLTPDIDGVVRKTPLYRGYREMLMPALSVATLSSTGMLSWQGDGKRLVDSKERVVPLVNELYDIAFYTRFIEYPFASIVASAKNLSEGDVEKLLIHPDEFRDKIVFIGASAAGLDDLRPNPLSAAAPGVHVHASVVGNVLANDYLRRVPAYLGFIAVVALALGCGFATALVSRIVVQLLLPSLVIILFVGAAFWMFSQGWNLLMTPPLMAALVAWIVAMAYINVIHGKDRRKVRRLLSQYVSPSVLAAVVDKYEDVVGAHVGSREEMTVLFSDVRSFTTMSENLEAEQVVDLLNAHFGVMTEIIFRHDGTLDKFIGDAIMAFWGAPLRTADHAEKAVRAGLEMVVGLDLVNAQLRSRSLPQIQVGIGLNTGSVVLGNIGSERKLDYTVIGDNVNLASRMEGLTSKYGCAVLLSESTFEAVEGKFECALVDRVRVKGKKKPIGIYVPMALLENVIGESEWSATKAAMESAFSFYCDRKWELALSAYAAVPFDGIRNLFEKRCRDFQINPPDPQWDGVTNLDSK